MRINIVALATLAVSLAASSFADSPQCPVNYGYSGFAGPSQWKYLEGGSLCGDGKTQSPVTLKNAHAVKRDALHFDYHRSSLALSNSGHDFRGVMPEGMNNYVFLPGEPDAGYRLLNFHFHTPNEHVLPNHSFDGEMHLVHDRGGQIAVVAIFIKIGKKNEKLEPVFNRLPLHLCDGIVMELDLNDLLTTAKGDYYTYTGSLTTPGCTEGVRFFIFPRPIEISQSQYDKLAKFGKNARPLQSNSNPIELVHAK